MPDRRRILSPSGLLFAMALVFATGALLGRGSDIPADVVGLSITNLDSTAASPLSPALVLRRAPATRVLAFGDGYHASALLAGAVDAGSPTGSRR